MLAQLSKMRPSAYALWRQIRSIHSVPARLHSKGPGGDKPLTFSSSKASNWNSVNSFGPPARDAPWYEMWSVLGSLSAFLIYFCILREENDLDRELEESVYSRVPGLEEQSLLRCIEYNTERGLDTKELKERLQVVQEDKRRVSAT